MKRRTRDEAFEVLARELKRLRDRPYTEVKVVVKQGGHATTETRKLWKRGCKPL